MIGFLVLIILIVIVLPFIIIKNLHNFFKNKIDKRLLLLICFLIITIEVIWLIKTWKVFVHLK